MKPFALPAPAVARLAATGAVLGPACDAIHNQFLLEYSVLPISAFGARSSLLIPPLLALTYGLLGGVFPLVARQFVGTGGVAPLLRLDSSERDCAILAVLATCGVLKLSAVLLAADVPHSLSFLWASALFEWVALDASYASLLLGLAVAVAGPIAEIPFMELNCWTYVSPDSWPLHGVVDDSAATGISSLTAPCYFAVTQDAVALGRWFASGEPGLGEQDR